MIVDPRSVAGKTLDVAGHADLLVVGAGPAGLAAALEGARLGLAVTLVDENPVAAETMGESIPQLWGQRAGGIVRNRNAMTEAMLTSAPGLEEAFEAGVDVRLGTACLGLWVNHANLDWLPTPLATLAADDGTSLMSFDRAIVACGRRDMGLAFPGWDRPGVVGANAAVQLCERYGALDGRVAVVLGTTAEALLAAQRLLAAGISVAAVVEQAERPVGPADLVAEITAAGVPVLCGETVRGTDGDLDGVTAVRLSERSLACDLVVLGIGAVPVIDLLDAAGCRTVFDPARGGFVPRLEQATTTLPPILAAGDCIGIWPEKSRNPAVAEEEGRRAARRAAGAEIDEPPPPVATYDLDAYRKGWVAACVVGAAGEPHVCLCEEVTAREILELRPPRYLGLPVVEERGDLVTLLGAGPPDPDQVKRLTRAGMGPCQGRRCREQVQTLLALQAELPLGAVPLAGYRSPVRPVSLTAFAPAKEDPAIGEQWDSWFGMPRQWVPFWDVEEKYTVAGLAVEKPHVSE